MNLPTFSSLGRAIACPSSVVLPHVYDDSEAARAGRIRHAFLNQIFRIGRTAALKAVPLEYVAMCEAMDIDAILAYFDGCAPIRSEVALAWNPETRKARFLGENIDRKYIEAGADMEHELCGALDVHALDKAKGVVRIVDMKGKAAGDPWQLVGQAVAATAFYTADEAEVRFAHVNDDGSIGWTEPQHWTALDLDGYAAELQSLARRVRAAAAVLAEGSVPNVTEGDWCGYCPARRQCPAKTALIRAADDALVELRPDVSALTPQQRAKAWVLVERYLPLLKDIDAALRASALEEPIDLGNGRIVKATPGYEKIDAEVGLAALANYFGSAELARRCATLTLSKRSIADGVGGNKEAMRALDVLRRAGAITQGPPIVRVMKAKETK